MAAMSGVLNHPTNAAQALTATSAVPKAAASSTSSTSSTSSDSATITANDFLTLLVTEMRNQDPTADTDPNEYINQLVNVNSLEQLISINQTLTTAFEPVSASSEASSNTSTAQASSLTGSSAKAQAAASGSTSTAAQSTTSSSASTVPNAISVAANQLAPGNLGIPPINQAAQSVAQSLTKRSSVQ
jgi:flagellar basal-body rod modification protein FlgD